MSWEDYYKYRVGEDLELGWSGLFEYTSRHSLWRIMGNHKNLSQNSWQPSRDSSRVQVQNATTTPICWAGPAGQSVNSDPSWCPLRTPSHLGIPQAVHYRYLW